MSDQGPDLRLEMRSQARYLAAARSLIASAAQRLGFDEMQCGQISLAVDEALCNIIKHGYAGRSDGRIWLSVWGIPEPRLGIRIEIDDLGQQVEPTQIRSRDLEDIRPGGLGVYIIREVMDEVSYEQRAEGA